MGGGGLGGGGVLGLLGILDKHSKKILKLSYPIKS